MSDGLNDARAMRVAEVMTDVRNLLHYLMQLQQQATSSAEEYYLEGYSLLRQCIVEAQTIVQQPFAGGSAAASGDAEQDERHLRVIIVDAAIRRFKSQRAYLRSHAGLRWVQSRASILHGQRPNASHLAALQHIDATLRNEVSVLTDAYIYSTLRAQDTQAGKWLQEDPSLAQIQQKIASGR